MGWKLVDVCVMLFGGFMGIHGNTAEKLALALKGGHKLEVLSILFCIGFGFSHVVVQHILPERSKIV